MINKAYISILLTGISLLLLSCASNKNVTSTSTDSLEISIYRAVNNYRITRRLDPLTYDQGLSKIARQHSIAMATGRLPFSHTGATERAADARARIPGAGRISENLAWSTPREKVAEFFVKRWDASDEGHKEAMIGPFSITGVGVATAKDGRVFVTQIFVATEDAIR